jgi:hypothetical protein
VMKQEDRHPLLLTDASPRRVHSETGFSLNARGWPERDAAPIVLF